MDGKAFFYLADEELLARMLAHTFLPRCFSWAASILGPTRRQVNAKGLFREVQATEEGLEAGVGAEPGGVWALAQGVCVPGAHVYAGPFRLAAALVAACGMSVGFLPWGSSKLYHSLCVE